jgi:hypothetical protein
MWHRVGVVLGLFLIASGAHATPVFTDWTSVDTTANSASGTLGGAAVEIAGGDINFALLDGSGAIFANSGVFSPAIPLSDWVEITGSFTTTFKYTITFGAAVTDPILHIGSLASTITFTGIPVTKLSGEAAFVVAGSSVTGEFGANDRSGTILLSGTFTTISFSVDALALYTNDRDGIALQIGTAQPVPEPIVSALLSAAALALASSRRRSR